MRRSLPAYALALVAAVLLAGCDAESPVTPPEPCTGSVDVSVSSGIQPTFSWTPSCGVREIRVVAPMPSTSQVLTMWSLVSPELSIPSGTRYGQVPAGANESVSALPLERGRNYGVTVRGAGGQVLGAAEFVP